MLTGPFTIDGVAGPLIVHMHLLTGRCSVTVDGKPAPGRRRRFSLPATNGGAVGARIRSSLVDPYPIIQIGPKRYRTGPEVPGWLKVLTALPLALIFVGFVVSSASLPIVGGLLGGLVAGTGVAVNLAISRTSRPAAVKAGLMVAVFVATAAVNIALGSAIVGLSR